MAKSEPIKLTSKQALVATLRELRTGEHADVRDAPDGKGATIHRSPGGERAYDWVKDQVT